MVCYVGAPSRKSSSWIGADPPQPNRHGPFMSFRPATPNAHRDQTHVILEVRRWPSFGQVSYCRSRTGEHTSFARLPSCFRLEASFFRKLGETVASSIAEQRCHEIPISPFHAACFVRKENDDECQRDCRAANDGRLDTPASPAILASSHNRTMNCENTIILGTDPNGT